jgi:hypothetical protein
MKACVMNEETTFIKRRITMKRYLSMIIFPALVLAPFIQPSVLGVDIFFEDFEADDGGLTGSLDWEWGDYSWIGVTCYGNNYPPPGAYSGTRMWGTVLNDCYVDRGNNQGYDTCENTAPGDDSILIFMVDLTGYTDATLTFYEWFDLFLAWDWGEIYVNGDVVFQHCGGSHVIPTEWVEQSIDLTPYTGGIATIAIHMMASTVVNYAGWYIDDIRITASEPLPTATPTPTPECLHTGDTNQDGVITAADAQMAFQIVLGQVMPTYEEACAADCNGDDLVTAADAQNIFLVVLGLGTCVDPL